MQLAGERLSAFSLPLPPLSKHRRRRRCLTQNQTVEEEGVGFCVAATLFSPYTRISGVLLLQNNTKAAEVEGKGGGGGGMGHGGGVV